ncbi:MAG: hydrogenase nickel incorporation protein HypB [Alphaproteobacteria bacterium]|nr:hydrogenase nickel incorporation protein HypB [Alphaproteobacteria bacterium]
MCISCGCSGPEHHHDHAHRPLGAHHHHEVSAARAVTVEEDILAENNRFAVENRSLLAVHRILALNMVSSPGAGKTSLLAKTLSDKSLKGAVIEGDLSTDHDAKRIRQTGAPAVQINTGQGCHLDAHGVAHALRDLGVPAGTLDQGVLFIENVGNLVCPAAFDLGEAAKVVLLSVTEGEDKPAKYPPMFAAARLMLLTKIDLLPHLNFDIVRCKAYAREVNPDLEIIEISVQTGEGMKEWLSWINKQKV